MNATQIEPTAALADLKEKKPESVTIVCLSGDMDKAMAAFIIATGAAAMGMKVTMFFTFWGLNIIRKPESTSSAKDWMRKAFGWINKGGANNLPLSRFHFGGLGSSMMKTVMQNNRMPGIAELLETAQDLDVKLIACTTTLGMLGIPKDSLIDGVDELAGVSTYLAEARHGSVNLFI